MNGIYVPEEVTHYFIGGTYIKQYQLPAGHVAVTHKHKFNHATVLASGEAVVTAGLSTYPVRAPAVLEIVAGVNHSIKALTDTVWYCIHATEETDANKIDHELIVSA